MLHYTEEGAYGRGHVEVKSARVCCLLWSTEAYESDTSVSTLLNSTDNEAYGDISLASSDSHGLKHAKVLVLDRKRSRPNFRAVVEASFSMDTDNGYW